MKEFVEPVENEVITDSTERFIIGVNDFKQSSGYWYSVFALRILPFLLLILPVNVVLGRISDLIQSRFQLEYNLRGTPLLVMWIIVMGGFLAVSIFAPKSATVFELIIGFAYLFFAFRHHLFGSLLGYFVLIGMIIFLLVKLVFLAFALIGKIKFSADGKNVERDESGRVVRAVEEDVYYTKEDVAESEITPIEDEVYFSDINNDEQSVPITDNEVYFIKEDKNADNHPATDNDFVFGN